MSYSKKGTIFCKTFNIYQIKPLSLNFLCFFLNPNGFSTIFFVFVLFRQVKCQTQKILGLVQTTKVRVIHLQIIRDLIGKYSFYIFYSCKRGNMLLGHLFCKVFQKISNVSYQRYYKLSTDEVLRVILRKSRFCFLQ